MFSNTVYVAVWQPYNSTWARALVTQMRRCTMTVILTYRLVCREGAMCVWLLCMLLCLWLCVHVGVCTSCHVSLRWRHCLGRKRLRLRIDFLPFWLTMYDVSCCFVTKWSLRIIESFFVWWLWLYLLAVLFVCHMLVAIWFYWCAFANFARGKNVPGFCLSEYQLKWWLQVIT